MTQHTDATTETESTPSNSHAASDAGEMAQPDSERLSDDELLGLYRDDSSNAASFLLRRNLYRALDAAGITGVEHLDIVFDDENPEEPAVALLPLEGDETDLANNARKVRYDGDSAEVRIPPSVLGGGDHPGGIPSDLGLELDEYSNDTKLLFEPVIGEGFLLLLPVRWEDGDVYVAPTSEAAPDDMTQPKVTPAGVESETDSETAAETTPETVDGSEETAPGTAISRSIIAQTSQSSGVDEASLEDALAAVQVSADTVSWQTPVQYQPVEADVGGQPVVVHIVPEGVWDELAEVAHDEFDTDVDDVSGQAALDAAELAHIATAREIVERTGRDSYRHFEAEHSALVTLPDE
jgi:hypothetical protein